jgi:hypothetical protein
MANRTRSILGWSTALNELAIAYGERFTRATRY